MSNPITEKSSEDIDIGEVARTATRQAYEKARQHHLRLLMAKDGSLVEVTGDGEEIKIRSLHKARKIAVGKVFSLRVPGK